MHAWRDDDLHTWLIHEDRHESDTADAAFARLMQTLPLERPRADFADVVLAAWKANRRAARRLRLARLAAIVVFAMLTALASIAVLYSAGGSLLDVLDGATGALTHGARAFAAIARIVVRCWGAARRVSDFTQVVVGSGPVTAGLLAMEAIALIALVTLRRLIRAGTSASESMEAWI